MFSIKTLLNKIIMLHLLSVLNTKALTNKNSVTTGNYKTLQTGTFYLNSERPLWILQDQKEESSYKPKILEEKVKYKQIKPLYYHNRQQHTINTAMQQRNYKNSKTKAQKRLSSKGLQLPRNYIPLKKSSNPNLQTSSRRYHNSKFMKNMPIFDAAPGDEAYTQFTPIFIYTGHKGRMLVNTMLSKRKYPMQEPVPGQVLYPPQTQVFKPKPLVENFQRKMNVTMIPFYAYEAIDPRNQQQLITTTSRALVSSSSFKPLKKYKKAKQYSAFFSPQEVLAQPITDLSHHQYQITYTTNSPLTLEKPYYNHRSSNDYSPTTTTPLPHKKFEVTYNDGEDKFQITYEDDSPHLERPINVQTTQFTTTSAPLPYQSYTFDKNYYAFPLYTMGKLMEKDDTIQTQEGTRRDDADVTVEQQRIASLKKANDSLLNKSNEDTWFILNSRYKGPSKTNLNNLHSSKYIQSPVRVKDDFNLHKLETTTKAALKPQMRSLYGENINIIL